MIVARWWPYLGSPTALGDEGIYLKAFEAVRQGLDPTEIGGFYYPRSFSAAGGWLLEAVGEAATRVVLRVMSVLGLTLTIWIAACLATLSWGWRLGLCGLYASVSPGVYYGIETGNISFAVIGAILLALAVWPLRPVGAGFLLGGSTAIKPLAPLAILALLTHRPQPATRRQLVAGGAAALVAAFLLALNPSYLTTSSDAVHRLPFIRSISLNRILTLVGLELSPLVIASIVGLAVVIVARYRPMRRPTMLCFGGLAAVLAVPIIWSHTLLLTLPLQVLALSRARQRRLAATTEETRSPGGGVWLRYEWLFVILAVAALQLTQGAGAVDDQAMWFQLVVLTGAYLAGPALMAYVLATE